MDRSRYVMVEIPDGSLLVGLDESIEPPSPTEEPEIQENREIREIQEFVNVNDICRVYSCVNMVLNILWFSSQPSIITFTNIIVSIYSTLMSHTKINISVHGMSVIYIPLSFAITYSGGLAAYYVSLFNWVRCGYYIIWFIMSFISIITLEYTI